MREFFEGLLRQAAVAGDNAALVSANGALSYRALLERVRGHAQWATRLPHRVGLLFTKGTDCVVCDLALSFAGKEWSRCPNSSPTPSFCTLFKWRSCPTWSPIEHQRSAPSDSG